MDSYSFSSEEMDSAEAESWAEEQEDMCMGEQEWEHEEHQRNERIDSATYNIHE